MNFVNVVGWALYGVRLTDIATCYKVLPTDLYHRLELTAERFELCTEMTAKLFRLGVPIREVPISYHPRTRAEGKKIGWRDVWPFTKALIEWRFRSRPGTADAETFPSRLSPTLAAPAIASK